MCNKLDGCYMELWKSVIGYEDSYEVSNFGRVKAIERQQVSYGGRTWVKPERVLKPTFDGRYMVLSCSKDGVRNRFYVHELALSAFLELRPVGLHACHGDGDGRNNHIANLRWDTPKANNEDKVKHGTLPKGESHGMNKYSESDILKVKTMLRDGGKTHERIALECKVGRMTVAAISTGRQWSHLDAAA